MKYAVRYASRGGNTKAVADTIAKELDVRAYRVSEEISEPVDVLFLGGSVLFNAPTKPMKEFLASLDKSKVSKVVVFGTAEFSAAAVNAIEKAAKEKGIETATDKLLLKLGYQGFSLFAPAGGDLKAEQIKTVQDFVAKTK